MNRDCKNIWKTKTARSIKNSSATRWSNREESCCRLEYQYGTVQTRLGKSAAIRQKSVRLAADLHGPARQVLENGPKVQVRRIYVVRSLDRKCESWWIRMVCSGKSNRVLEHIQNWKIDRIHSKIVCKYSLINFPNSRRTKQSVAFLKSENSLCYLRFTVYMYFFKSISVTPFMQFHFMNMLFASSVCF